MVDTFVVSRSVRAALFAPLLLAGCASWYGEVRAPAMPHLANSYAPSASHCLGCPDVIAIAVKGRPEFDSLAMLDLDGRVQLGSRDPIRFEGLTLVEARTRLAEALGEPLDSVAVALVESQRGRILLQSPSGCVPVPLSGSERLAEVFERVGGIEAQGKIAILRPNVAEGVPPQWFEFDVESVPLVGSPANAFELQSGDHVFVETPTVKSGPIAKRIERLKIKGQ